MKVQDKICNHNHQEEQLLVTVPRIPSTKATLTIAQFDLSHQRRHFTWGSAENVLRKYEWKTLFKSAQTHLQNQEGAEATDFKLQL